MGWRVATWTCILATLAGVLRPVGGFAPPLSCRRVGVSCGGRQCDLRAPARAKSPRVPLRAPRLLMQEGEPEGLSDADISGLLARVSAAKDRVQTLPVCILDATLPRQRLEFATSDKSFLALIAHCREAAGGDGRGKFGMLGPFLSRRYLSWHCTPFFSASRSKALVIPCVGSGRACSRSTPDVSLTFRCLLPITRCGPLEPSHHAAGHRGRNHEGGRAA